MTVDGLVTSNYYNAGARHGRHVFRASGHLSSGVLKSTVSAPSGVRGRAPAKNEFGAL